MGCDGARVVVGVDLAWSARNRTGIAIAIPAANGYALGSAITVLTDDEIVAEIARAAGDAAALVTIDAPLRVPNDAGRRGCEHSLSADYGSRHAGTHSSNRTLFARYGGVRGERIVEALAKLGFVLRGGTDLASHPRSVVEVYPHPALVNLLDAPLALKYKRKSGRSAETRAQAWSTLKTGLRGFAHATPSLIGLDALLRENDAECSGRASKEYEDRIDAVVCAYIGMHALHWGEAGGRVYGGIDEGAILVPIKPGVAM